MAQEQKLDYRFVTYISAEVEPEYGRWMKFERIRKIMDQRDEREGLVGKQLLSNPQLSMALDSKGNKVYKLEFDTTTDKNAEYNKRVDIMKKHTGDTYKDYKIFTPESPIQFKKEYSNEESYGSLLNDQATGKPLKFRPLDISRKAEYTVRIDIADPEKLPSSYEDWIKKHADEMKSLRDADGNAYFADVKIRKANENGKDIYLVDYKTTNLQFWKYENDHADRMRNIFKDTYGENVSQFAFQRSLLEEGSTFTQTREHAKMKDGSKGQSLTYDTIYQNGHAL